jgi:hypothetical protein
LCARERLQNALAHESRDMTGESAGNRTTVHEKAALKIVLDGTAGQVG